jgi:uncharacterized protein (DUF1330 family)
MAYVIVTIKTILDQKAFEEYAEKVRPVLRNYEGRWVAIEPQHLRGLARAFRYSLKEHLSG